MAQIVLDQVDKVYPGGAKGVDGLSLDISDGEFMVLVGPSGCGKSTALRSIAGLEEITSGTITIGNRVVNDLPPKDRDIAMVFQNYALYPHMTVEQNLAFGLEQRKTPKPEIRRRVTEVAQMLGLEEYLKRKPAALSGGQRQRVAMGRAIVREPQAFLMDEPLSNLDAKLRVSMRASLSQLHERLGVTTVYVTHDQVEAMTLGQRVCVLREGRLQQVDSPQVLYNAPVNLFVAGFIGSPAMNFATATLVRDDGPAVTFAGHRLAIPQSVLTARPGLDAYFGREFILGIRPSDFEDAELAEAGWPRMPVTTTVTEELGSEINVIFPIDAPPVQHASIAQAASDDDEDGAIPLAGNKTMWTARVAARSHDQAGPVGDARGGQRQPSVLRLRERPGHRPPGQRQRRGLARASGPGPAGARTAGVASGVHDDQVARDVVEPREAALGADHDVLDARAVRAGVDARLDGERVPGHQGLGVAGHDVGILVGLQPDAVAGAVHEELAVAGRGDRLPGRRVDGLGGDAGPDGRARGLLGGLEHAVVLGELRRRLADGVGAGAVRAVAAGHGPADVHHDHVAGLEDPPGRGVMRAGGVRPGRHDREVGLGVALLDDGVADVGGDLLLGAARPQPAGHPAVHPVDGLARRAQGGDLGRLLRARSSRRARLASSWPASGSAARSRSTISAHIRSDSPTAAGPAPELARDQRVRVVGLVPADDLQAQPAGRRGLGGRELQVAARAGPARPRPPRPAAPGRSAARADARRSRSGSAGRARGKQQGIEPRGPGRRGRGAASRPPGTDPPGHFRWSSWRPPLCR